MLENCARGTFQTTGQLTYKFQRLREQLRSAVLGGEFTGRLPGERELGRRFKANAKTINKALCDLSSEGLVVRQIGRGTFIVPREGQDRFVQSAKSFRCLVPAAHADAAHRRRLVEQIRIALESQGHRVEESQLTHGGAARQTLLSTWSVAERQATDGLFFLPADPLSGPSEQLDDASTSEIIRRHLPCVLIGAHAKTIKLDTVVPDYVDAGYRLAEYLVRHGCARVVVVASTEEVREFELVFGAASAACQRHGVACDRVSVERMDGHFDRLASILEASENGHQVAQGPVGVLCIGAKVLNGLLANKMQSGQTSPARTEFACVLEPGDDRAHQAGVAYYAVSVERLAHWAVRLMLDAKPGHRPVEIIVPGMVCVPAASPRNPHSMALPDRLNDQSARPLSTLVEGVV